MSLLPRWFETQPFERQVVVLAVVLDPIGFTAGYLLAPELGVEPILGGVYGLIAASLPLSLLVMREASAN
ncbi:hypothetical protein SAMN04488066_103226 [Halorubrum aquaticum]|uniref:DUF8141 domain-containing protein n=1 Tax=Halorubrum aquaticum TaxID=387340 RepID=A0A1I2ZWX6_9EURY|nr:hypothetical protein [Halorubrum aquaticum]SFH42333.1 hypothetical protein SAMN04488066_103226 [Halorubrum aquaticum]